MRMSQILSLLWAGLQKYHSIQQSHGSWQPSTPCSCYTITLSLTEYYRQIFLSDRIVMVCLHNHYIMILLTLLLSFSKANAWKKLSIESIRWLMNHRNMKGVFNLIWPWTSVTYLEIHLANCRYALCNKINRTIEVLTSHFWEQSRSGVPGLNVDVHICSDKWNSSCWVSSCWTHLGFLNVVLNFFGTKEKI